MKENFKDITALCALAARELSNENPMLNSEDFSLLDSMSAVELMDPKMDQCFGFESSNLSEQYSVELSNSDPVRLVTQLFQTMFVNAIAFFDGASLLESTHQCVPMWPDSWPFLQRAVDSELEAPSYRKIILLYAQSSHKTLSSVNKLILDSDIYEDEDFHPLSLPLLRDQDIDGELLLEEVATAALQFVNDFGHSDDVCVSLLVRLQSSQQCFWKAVAHWVRLCQTQDGDEADSQQMDALNRVKTTLMEALTAIDDVLQLLNSPAGSNRLLDGSITSYTHLPLLKSVYKESLVKIWLNNPLRSIALKSFQESLKHLRGIVADIGRVYDVALEFGGTSSPSSTNALEYETLLHAALHFSSQKMHLLARSCLVSVFQSKGHCMVELLLASMHRRGLPKVLLETDLVSVHWLKSLARVVGDTLRALMANRTKQMPRLDRVLEMWGTVAGDAGIIDRQFHLLLIQSDGSSGGTGVGGSNIGLQQWCSTWTLLTTCLLMDLQLALTIEMNLMNISEMDYFYWYWDYVCSNRIWALDSLRKLSLALIEDMNSRGGVRDKDVKKTGKRSVTAAEQAAATNVEPTAEELFVLARGQMCRAQFRLCVAAQRAGLAALQKYEDNDDTDPSSYAPRTNSISSKYTSWSHRFAMRFRAFQCIPNPAPISYTDFQAVISSRAENNDAVLLTGLTASIGIMESASACFSNARKYIDILRKSTRPCTNAADKYSAEECTKVLKAIVANAVNAMRCTKLLREKQNLNNGGIGVIEKACIVLDHTHDDHFPVIEIKL